MRAKQALFSATVGILGVFLCVPPVANGGSPVITAVSAQGEPSSTPSTVGEALKNREFLDRFDSVDLAASQPKAPVVDGRSLASGTAKASNPCSWTAFTSILGGYGPVSRGCGIAGHPGYYKPYRWTYGAAASICSLGIGYNSSNKATWYYTGCAGGTRTVPWGNNLATSQFKVTGPALNMFVVPWTD